MRQAIPPTFRFERALMLTGLTGAPGALMVAWALSEAIANPRDSSYYSVYSGHASGDWGVLVFLLLFSISLPTYALVRCARTSEAMPLITLGLLQASPLLLGFFVQLGLLLNGLSSIFMMFAGGLALLMATAAIASGAALGAKDNGRAHRRKMKKAGAHVF